MKSRMEDKHLRSRRHARLLPFRFTEGRSHKARLRFIDASREIRASCLHILGAAMHQNTITIEQFTDIQQQLRIFGRVESGAVATTIGKHPLLGSCVVFDDMTSDLVLLSELHLNQAGYADQRLSHT